MYYFVVSVEDHKQHVIAQREEFLLNARYGVDEALRPAKAKEESPGGMWGVMGSFRKMAVD